MPTASLFPSIAHLFLDALVDECASFNLFAHSSQQTSTVFPPTLTLIGFPSSLQSHAAQVLAPIASLSNTQSPRTGSKPHRKRRSLSESLAICLKRVNDVGSTAPLAPEALPFSLNAQRIVTLVMLVQGLWCFSVVGYFRFLFQRLVMRTQRNTKNASPLRMLRNA